MPESQDQSNNGFEEGPIVRNWDPTELLNFLYKIEYSPKIEQKRSEFRNMEGQLELNDQDPELNKEWKKLYFRTKDCRFEWFASKYADEHSIGEISLSDAEIIPNREDFAITVINKKEQKQTKIVVRVPSNLFDKWRQSLLSHRDLNIIDSYVQPSKPLIPYLNEKILIIDIGLASIRAGILYNKPSLPQLFFSSYGCIFENNKIIVGMDAFKLENRNSGKLLQLIEASENSVEQNKLNIEIFKACIQKIISDLNINSIGYSVLLSIPHNLPTIYIPDLLKTLLNEFNFKAATIAKQPNLILCSYGLTTGIVVDIGERLNIIPVVDEYIVENAIVSLPFVAKNIRNSVRKSLENKNDGLYTYQSPIETLLLKCIVEQICYVATDFDEEEKKSDISKQVDFSNFNIIYGMDKNLTIDKSRYLATEGIFKPNMWNLDHKGLHQLINNGIQLSPIDSRKTLYKNIFLSGGTSMLPGMAERIENELAKMVANNIQVKVHMSPWRYHASYLGAQVIASAKTFNKCCVTNENLSEYLKALESEFCSNNN